MSPDVQIATLNPGWVIPLAAGLLLGAAAMAALGARTVGSPAGSSPARSLLVPLQESARLLRQRPRRTVSADLMLWRFATSALVPLALLMVVFVPWGTRTLVASDVGVVWFNALDVMVWALVWLAGWGANAAYPLIGGYRFLAIALAYELPLMFALVAPPIAAGSLDIAVIGQSQDVWNVVWMPVAFVAYCWGVLGFSLRGPMDASLGRDLAGGVLAELSGVDRLLFLAGRHCLLVAGAAFAVPLFLGGGSGPLLPDPVWIIVKALLLSAALVALGRRVPTMRPDRLMEVAWVIVLPAVLVQDLVVAVVAVGLN